MLSQRFHKAKEVRSDRLAIHIRERDASSAAVGTSYALYSRRAASASRLAPFALRGGWKSFLP